ncbi:hypothetical protein FH972_026190 [Carpinus fangiana]|uniref:Histone-lysine N-methyltransferase, H3 lysine-79 specific n=1 Tax=Carpinus fangiana TaxID=176857 RepID=A0A5N6L3L3_9ROSI|nr:hypothetical protein FH972_026190 [Carpinus fangiana]
MGGREGILLVKSVGLVVASLGGHASKVLLGDFAALLPFAHILATQVVVSAVLARRQAITFCPELVALVAGFADAATDRGGGRLAGVVGGVRVGRVPVVGCVLGLVVLGLVSLKVRRCGNGGQGAHLGHCGGEMESQVLRAGMEGVGETGEVWGTTGVASSARAVDTGRPWIGTGGRWTRARNKTSRTRPLVGRCGRWLACGGVAWCGSLRGLCATGDAAGKRTQRARRATSGGGFFLPAWPGGSTWRRTLLDALQSGRSPDQCLDMMHQLGDAGRLQCCDSCRSETLSLRSRLPCRAVPPSSACPPPASKRYAARLTLASTFGGPVVRSPAATWRGLATPAAAHIPGLLVDALRLPATKSSAPLVEATAGRGRADARLEHWATALPRFGSEPSPSVRHFSALSSARAAAQAATRDVGQKREHASIVMSSFFGKKKTAGAPVIRREVRRVPVADSTARNQASSTTPSARPPRSGPPPGRYTLTPNARSTPRPSPASKAAPALKTRATEIRTGQKRKSASPKPNVLKPDFGSSSDNDDSDDNTLPSNKKQKITPALIDNTRRVRDVDSWPSPGAWSDALTSSEDDAGLIHGRDLCTGEFAKDFVPAFTASSSDPIASVLLQYPSGRPAESFLLVNPKKEIDYHPVEDIVNSMVETLKHYLPATISDPLLNPSDSGINTTIAFRMRRAYRHKSLADFEVTIKDYNEILKTHLRDGQIAAHLDNRDLFQTPLKFDLVERILSQVYVRTVSPRVEILSKYANKENTYGELREKFASQIFKDTELKSTHIFLDLGSGVGNVVLQAALEVGCESYGIEMMDAPCQLADAQAAEFPRRAKLWGLNPGSIKLWKGDFLEDALVSQLLPKADVVLVNNEVFGPDLNNALKDRLLDLKEGAQLVSLQSFVPDGWRLSQTTRNDPVAGLEVTQKRFSENWVSWKWEGGKYFLAKKDSARIERLLDSGSARSVVAGGGRARARARAA